MKEQFKRTGRLLGEAAMAKLAASRVAVFGVGGVGGYVCEALARSGVGTLDIVDMDRVELTNINRQIIALQSSLGRPKTEVMRERIRDIDPDVQVNARECFFLPENAESFPFGEYDYVVDAVDTVTAKIEIILRAKKEGVPVISAMGAGNKLDPGKLRTADIYDTQICPLARIMRRELKKRDIKSLKVVYSEEMPIRPEPEDTEHSGAGESGRGRKDTPGSAIFVPAAMGLMIASQVVKDLCGIC